MKRLISHLTAALCCAFLASGCASTARGPAFQPILDRPADKGVVYVYWPNPKTAPSNARTKFSIRVNNTKTGTLKKGGYLPLLVTPGEAELATKVQFKFMATGLLDVAANPARKLELDVKAGETYYVRCTPKGLNNNKLELALVSPAQGLQEIRHAKLVQ